MIRCAICDDQKEISQRIGEITDRLFKENHLVSEVRMYTDSQELYFDIYEDIYFDIVFLDIEMPNYDGMQIAKMLKEKQPECLIIFLTAYNKYAIDAFELGIFRYIPKDEVEIRFEKYLMEALKQIRSIDEQGYIIYKKGNIERIPYKNIRYITKNGKYTSICCTDNHEAKVRKPINTVVKELNSPNFVVIDRGCAVNICYISKLVDCDVYLKSGERLPISRSNVKSLRELIIQYWGEIY